MSRAEALEAILQLLPSAPASGEAKARLRLGQLSSGELQRMHEYLSSLVERRSPDNARRKRWEEAQSRVRTLANLQPVFSEWETINQRAAGWLRDIDATQSIAVEAAPKKAIAELVSREIQKPTLPDIDRLWSEALGSLHEDLSTGSEKDLDLPSIAERLSERLAESEFDMRLSLLHALRSELAKYSGSASSGYPAYTLHELSPVLPWDWFRSRIVSLRRRFQHDTDAVFTDHDRALLNRFLTELRLEEAPRLNLSDAERDPDELTVFITIVNTLWHVPVKLVPRVMQGDIVRLFDLGARRLEAVASDAVSRSQHLFLSQAIMRAYLYICKLTSLGGWNDPTNWARNLIGAFVAGERAGFLSTNSSFLEPGMTAELNACAGQMILEPEEYLANAIDRRRHQTTNFNIIVNAADVLRFAAHIEARFSNNLGKAADRLQVARKFFDYAKDLISDAVELPLYVSRATKARLLDASITRKRGRPDIALEKIKDTVSWVDKMASGVVDGGIQYLKCFALVAQARAADLTDDLDKAIIHGLTQLISDNPKMHAAWNLLADYYIDVKHDPDAAISHIGRWRDTVEAQNLHESHASHLTYRQARILFDIATADRRRIEDAVNAYIELLGSQPRNTVAFAELLELLVQLDTHVLASMGLRVDEALPDQERSPWAHALIRAIFGLVPSKGSTDALTVAVVKVLAADDAPGLQELAKLLSTAPLVDRMILELSSKYYWRRGRQLRRSGDLAIADRFLRVGLLADPDDVVWISRRIDVALEQRNWNDARQMIGTAKQKHPDDAIIQFQAGRLELLQGHAIEATTILQKLVNNQTTVSDGSAVDFHPAVVDQLALAALRQQRFEEAENYYRINLERQRLDPRGYIGIGRVYFERGRPFWRRALQNWGEALILQCDWNSFGSDRFARNTASLIGGLFRTDSDDQGVIAECEALLVREPNVLRFLAPTFASKRISTQLITAIMQVAESANDKLVQRSVAQLLRAKSIHAFRFTSAAALLSDISAHLEWCLKMGVLGDYLAGSKGSYARVLLRSHAQHMPIESSRTYTGVWKLLADHISRDGYVSEYYRKTEQLSAEISSSPIPEISDFVFWLTGYVLQQFESKLVYPERIMERLHSDIVLAAPSDLGELDELCPPRVSALVDEDIFRVAQQFMNGTGWRDGGAEIVRSVHRTPTAAQMFQFARGGIYFRPPSSASSPEAYLNVLPQGSRSIYEFETSGL